nr:MAG TPA: hypothetical protein [Caudoviricetes sp.]
MLKSLQLYNYNVLIIRMFYFPYVYPGNLIALYV